MNIEYRKFVKSPRYEVSFEEVTPLGHVEQWGESARLPFIKIKLTKIGGESRFTDASEHKILFYETAQVIIIKKNAEELMNIVKNFYEAYGPIAEEEITLFELRRRLSFFLFAISLWWTTKPAEGNDLMEQRRSIAGFLGSISGSRLIFPEGALEILPQSIVNFLDDDAALFLPALGHSDLKFNNEPDIDAPLEEKMKWIQRSVLRYTLKVLNKKTKMVLSSKANGTISVTATAGDIYTLMLLSVIFDKDKEKLHDCPGCGVLTSRQDYCSKSCKQKHAPEYTIRRVLSMFRTRMSRGTISKYEFEAIKDHVKKHKKRFSEYDDEKSTNVLELFLGKIRKEAK
ncbi:MAG: hypothetical protein A4E53_02062 [Pelotomaculum sp. PtaB.Bin104]|nr:MAG: hypothetical protein A4E53_02062 [Pelotomaculum sp. PtaB.Bin104]